MLFFVNHHFIIIIIIIIILLSTHLIFPISTQPTPPPLLHSPALPSPPSPPIIGTPCSGSSAGWHSSHITKGCCQPAWLLYVAALVAGTIFVFLSGFIGVYGWLIGREALKSTKFKVPFQPKGGGPHRVVLITLLIFLLFLTRALFDLAVFSPVTLIDASTQRTTDELVTFICYLFWEITPTTSIIFLFWDIPGRASGAGGGGSGGIGGKEGAWGLDLGRSEPTVQRESLEKGVEELKGGEGEEFKGGEGGGGGGPGVGGGYGTLPYSPYNVWGEGGGVGLSVGGHSAYPVGGGEASDNSEFSEVSGEEEERLI